MVKEADDFRTKKIAFLCRHDQQYQCQMKRRRVVGWNENTFFAGVRKSVAFLNRNSPPNHLSIRMIRRTSFVCVFFLFISLSLFLHCVYRFVITINKGISTNTKQTDFQSFSFLLNLINFDFSSLNLNFFLIRHNEVHSSYAHPYSWWFTMHWFFLF